LPTIGVEQTSRLDAILNEGVQARGRGVFNYPHPNPPNARAIGLGGYDDQGFTFGLSACNTLFQSTYHGFIYLAQPFSRSRSGRTIARLSLCSHVQAVS